MDGWEAGQAVLETRRLGDMQCFVSGGVILLHKPIPILRYGVLLPGPTRCSWKLRLRLVHVCVCATYPPSPKGKKG